MSYRLQFAECNKKGETYNYIRALNKMNFELVRKNLKQFKFL
jgi:hypothetical protein